MANNNNMLQLCRLCLVKDDVNIPIFEDQGDIRQIFLKISSCLPVKVTREDRLPKKICDGCSYKLDMLYEFWNTSANAEKQLLSWLGEAGVPSKMADGALTAVAQQMKPAEAFVKEETLEPPDGHADDDDKDYLFAQQKVEESASAGPSATVTSNEDEEPPPKRARRTAAVKAAIAMDQESDDDDDSGEPLTKIEDESEDSEGEDHVPAFVDVPSTSADDQPGPSGVGKDGVEAPFKIKKPRKIRNPLKRSKKNENSRDKMFLETVKEEWEPYLYVPRLPKIEQTTYLHEKKPSEGCKRRPKKTKIRNLSPNIKPCKKCGQHFDNTLAYRKHVRMHQEKYKICTMCGKSVVSLSQHMKSVHGDPTKEKCPTCDKTFSCKKHLHKHMLVHTNDFKHKCSTCGKGFKAAYNMRVHMRSHEEVKPFQCSLCSKTFTTKQWRDKHMTTHL